MVRTRDRGRHDRWLLAIAAFKYVKAALLVAIGLGALHLLDPAFVAHAERIIGIVMSALERQHLQHLLLHASRMSPAKIESFGIGAFLYAALFLVEGTGLWLHKHWAEYLTIVSTALLIPIEIYELVQRVTAPRVTTLAVNVAVLAYLLIRLHRRRAERHHKEQAS